jgi:uncharacterized membrane protein HdeD (DUF308 family)
MGSTTISEIEATWAGSHTATVAGMIIAILGVLAMAFPFVTGLSLSILLGAILVFGALVHVSHAFSAGSLGSVLGQVLLAVLYGFAGIAFMSNPVVGLATLTLLAISFFLADGIIEIAWGVRSRGEPGATWLLASGGISLLLAGFLWLGFPTSAVWAIGVFTGANLLVTGLAIILVGQGIGAVSPPDSPQVRQG